MKLAIKILMFLYSTICFSQEIPNFTAIDSLYREDQFYAGISYNILTNKNPEVDQGKFTPSFEFGFLRDMPINKKRTFAFAVGLGYAINNYNQNIQFTDNNGTFEYDIIQNVYEKNKMVLHYIEMPIEFRWRDSTPENHKFLRIYSGFKMAYLVYDYVKYVDGNGTVFAYNNQDLNKFQLSTYVSFGFNTWNLKIQYGLNPMFKNAILDNQNMKMQNLNLGFVFYLL